MVIDSHKNSNFERETKNEKLNEKLKNEKRDSIEINHRVRKWVRDINYCVIGHLLLVFV